MEYFGLDYLFVSHQRLFWVYLLSAAIIAILYVIFAHSVREEYAKRTIWLHSSALMDYKYFFVVSFIKVAVILPLILSSKDVALYVTLLLQESFGFIAPLALSKESVVLLYTLTLFVVGDFTRYWLHRAMHSVPLLWRFHKVHHSAVVLNPLTFYRVHPVENILFGLRYALSVGVVTGVFLYLFGAKIGLVQIVGANVFVFVFGILGANLRHSHIPLRYGDFLEKIFISPYQHQLHHTVQHSGKNFGGALAIWDALFQTLHREKAASNLEYGLGKATPYVSVLEMLYKPFIQK